jgi:enoyl-CoA hydratase/carnithine racemase
VQTAPTAKLWCAFVRVGLSCGELGTSYLLTRLLGYGRAAELGFTGRVVDAVEAERIGLVNRVVPSEELFAEADALAAAIARRPAPASAALKVGMLLARRASAAATRSTAAADKPSPAARSATSAPPCAQRCRMPSPKS